MCLMVSSITFLWRWRKRNVRGKVWAYPANRLPPKFWAPLVHRPEPVGHATCCAFFQVPVSRCSNLTGERTNQSVGAMSPQCLGYLGACDDCAIFFCLGRRTLRRGWGVGRVSWSSSHVDQQSDHLCCSFSCVATAGGWAHFLSLYLLFSEQRICNSFPRTAACECRFALHRSEGRIDKVLRSPCFYAAETLPCCHVYGMT